MATPPSVEVLPDELGLGEWRVRLAEGLLEAPGRRTRLEPRVAALLECLIRNRGRMVSREELLETVWYDAIVAPVALARAVSELRGALGDDARVPRYVETYPKRGYRLLAPVDLEPAASAPPALAAPKGSARRSWSALALVAVLLGVAAAASRTSVPAPAAARDSLVVLPFRGLDPESTAFAAGLTDDIFEDLATVDDVRVWPRGRTAEDLSSGAVLEGTVRRVDGRVHVTARLRERPGEGEIWSEAFDREVATGDSARSDVAGRIVHGLRIHGLRARQTRGSREQASAPSHGTSAFEMFRQGRAQLAGRDLRSVLDAQRTFERVIEQEPRFTLGRTGLALTLAMRTARTNELDHARRGVREAEASVAEDPNLPEAYQALARAHLVLGHHRQALEAAERALGLRPDFLMALSDRASAWRLQGDLERAWAAEVDLDARDHPAWRAFTRGRLGQLLLVFDLRADARRWLEHALRADPHDVDASVALARLEVLEGERAAARRRMEGLLAVDPTCRSCLVLAGRIALLDEEAGAARRALTRALELPGGRADVLTALALASGSGGRGRMLAQAGGEVRAALAEASEDGALRLSLAAIAAVEGDAGVAARRCGEAVDAGWRDHTWTALDPAFARVRADPRFVACLDRARGLVSAARGRIGPVATPRS